MSWRDAGLSADKINQLLLAAPAIRTTYDWLFVGMAVRSELPLLTIEDVREAAISWTATVPTITAERIAGLGDGTKFDPAVPGWLVVADGYRAGPAGDF